MASLEGLIQVLIGVVRDNLSAGLNYGAATTLLGYEILITLGDEIELVWRGAVFVVPVADILVITRLCALYNRNVKIVGPILALLWTAQLACIVGFIRHSFKSTAVMDNQLPGVLTGCFPTANPDSAAIITIGAIGISFQGIYLGFAVYVLLRRVRIAMSPLLKMFFRDGAVYYLVFTIVYLASVLLLVLSMGRPLQEIGQQ
ncbi:hypothetical protein M422DRAFT_239551 [Sphaerobolus stellatus SS14]|nr:hypothetical protein M422DRAFT_239551 [Sphaerobolus stellatus SS14]